MPDMDWTYDQRLAIELDGTALLVSAAAGSGKTAVLVQRVMERVLSKDDPKDIDSFLIVTFTKSAANEMRQKIMSRISSELQKDPDNIHLQRQLTLVYKADITTVHGFCNRLISENYHLLDIPVRYRIADEAEVLLLKNEIIDTILEEEYESQFGMDDFSLFIDMFANMRDDSSIADMVLQLYNNLQSNPFPGKWMDNVRTLFSTDKETPLENTKWGKIIISYSREALNHCISLSDKALSMINGDEDLEKCYLDAFKSDREIIDRVSSSIDTGSYDAIVDAFSGLSFQTLKAARGYDDKELLETLKGMRSNIKDSLSMLKEKYFYMPSKSFLEDIETICPAVLSFLSIVESFSKRYSQEKKKKNLLDFSDLEHLALELLLKEDNGIICPTDTAFQLRQKYTSVLVDEYQDTNEIQDLIFKALSKDGQNLFMVGDIKQSIYRFRQARPELFLEKYFSYEKDILANTPRKVCFTSNFRSRPQVLEFVNTVFERIMSSGLGEIEYTEGEFLNHGAKNYPQDENNIYKSEIILLDMSNMDDDDTQDDYDRAQLEAMAAAKRISELMESGFTVCDKKTGRSRPVEYRDIVILLRSVKHRAPVYEQVLSSYNIPAYCDVTSGYFAATEITVMFSLLKVIDNPRQDIPLISVMRSPIFGFSEDELVEIRMNGRKCDFYDAVVASSIAGNKKALEFLRKISIYRDKAVDMTVDRLIWYLYEDTGYYAMAGAMRGGDLRQANLHMLFEHARRYEETVYKGLFNFINFINRLFENEGELAQAKVLSENSNVVRIMSIHKSKGLEFPVCILGSMSSSFNFSDTHGQMLIDTDLGLGPQFRDTSKMITYPTIAKEALAIKAMRQSLSEEERILYVAMTRAKEKLIILGSDKNLEKTIKSSITLMQSSDGKISAYALSQCKNYLEWIISAIVSRKEAWMLRAYVNEGHEERCEGTIDIKILSPNDVLSWSKNCLSCQQSGDDDIDIRIDANESLIEEVKKRYTFEYSRPLLMKTPAKISVTELKGRLIDEELIEDTDQKQRYLPYEAKTPSFINNDGGLSPAQRGIALHAAMQHIDYTKTQSEHEIESELMRMECMGLITPEQHAGISISALATFFSSDLGRELKTAKRVWREEAFNLIVPVGDIYKDLSGECYKGETMLIQGVIDCFFEDNNGCVVLIDFKTDRIPSSNMDTIKDRYKIQLEIYDRAIMQIYRKNVSRRCVYLFSLGKEVDL